MIVRSTITAVLVAAVFAQPPGAPTPLPALEIREVIRSVEEAYRSGPIAERVTISVRTTAASAAGPPRPSRPGHSTIVIRAERADGKRAGSLRLEMPSFTLYLGHGRIVAVGQPPGKSIFLRDIGNASPLRAIEWSLPNLALPQLQLIFGDDRSWDCLTPFCPGATWEHPPQRNAEGAIELIAQMPSGQVTLTIDPVSRRILAAEIVSTATGDVSHIAIKCVAIEPGDPALWEIAPVGVRPVTVLGELVEPILEAHPGNSFARLLLQHESLEPFFLEDDFLSPRGPGRLPPTALVLIVFDAAARDKSADQLCVASRALQEVQRARILAAAATTEKVKIRALPAWRSLAVFKVTDFTRDTLAKTAALFCKQSEPPEYAIPGQEPARPLVWTLGGNDTLKTLCAGAESAIVVLGPDMHPARTIPLVQGQDHRELARAIEEAIARLEE